MALNRISERTVGAYDAEQLAREFDHQLNCLPSYQSGGERQRACIEDLRTLRQEQSRRTKIPQPA